MKQKHFIDYTLDEVERMVDPRKFSRVNRQFIVAKDIGSVMSHIMLPDVWLSAISGQLSAK